MIWLKASTKQQLMLRIAPKQQTTAGTHIILMQDLKYFVDVVEGVHSGGASLFGLRKRKCSSNQLTACSVFISQ